MPNLKKTEKKKHKLSDNELEAKEKFTRHLVHENALSTSNIKAENFDMEKAKQRSRDGIVALDANGGLQSMLAAQMLSIHELQQKTMTYANAIDDFELKKYYTNSAVKLANCFVQQANILAKLQGVGGQKIIVERVDVHQGGQAVVGNIQGDMGKKEKT